MTANAFAFGWSGGVPPGPPPYVPGTLPGLVLALETDLGLSGSSWTDQSTQGNNATIVGSPGAGTTINGKATLQINASSKYVTISDAASLRFGNDVAWDVFLVLVEQSQIANYGWYWDKASAGQPNAFGGYNNLISGLGVSYVYQAGAVYTTSGNIPSAATPYLIEHGANGGGVGGLVRYGVGASVGTVSQDLTNGAGSGTGPFIIGSDGGHAFPGTFDLAAIFVYANNAGAYLSAPNRAALVSYVNGKYGSIG